LDSTNFVHLDKDNMAIPEAIMNRVKERIKLGLKITDKWSI